MAAGAGLVGLEEAILDVLEEGVYEDEGRGECVAIEGDALVNIGSEPSIFDYYEVTGA